MPDKSRKYQAIWLLCILLLFSLMLLKARGDLEYRMGVDDLTWNGGYLEGFDHYVIDEKNEAGTICTTGYLNLPKGDYVVRVRYEEQFVENSVQVLYGGQEVLAPLPLEQTVFEQPIELKESVDDFIINIQYARTGKFVISGVDLISQRLLVTDNVFLPFLLFFSAACAVLVGKRAASGRRRLDEKPAEESACFSSRGPWPSPACPCWMPGYPADMISRFISGGWKA